MKKGKSLKVGQILKAKNKCTMLSAVDTGIDYLTIGANYKVNSIVSDGIYITNDLNEQHFFSKHELDNFFEIKNGITPANYLDKIGIDLNKTLLISYIDGHFRNPNLENIMQEYAEFKIKEKNENNA